MRNFNYEKLNHIIKSKGFQKKHVAAELGIAPPRLSEKLTGRIYVYPDELVRVLRVVGMSEESIAEQRLTDWYKEAAQ